MCDMEKEIDNLKGKKGRKLEKLFWGLAIVSLLTSIYLSNSFKLNQFASSFFTADKGISTSIFQDKNCQIYIGFEPKDKNTFGATNHNPFLIISFKKKEPRVRPSISFIATDFIGWPTRLTIWARSSATSVDNKIVEFKMINAQLSNRDSKAILEILKKSNKFDFRVDYFGEHTPLIKGQKVTGINLENFNSLYESCSNENK